jgi:hypothetical protein
MSLLEERVECGIIWLDERHPEWADRIDLATLNLADGCQCILGQLEGNFGVAVRHHGWGPFGLG